VATGPEGHGYTHLRASRADREQAIDTLKAAYVQGRLTKAELDERVGRALVPLTYAELDALTGDLPDGLIAVRRPRGASQGMARLQESNAARAGLLTALVAGVVVVAAVSGNSNPLHVLATVLLLSPAWMLALAGLLLLHSRLEKSATRRLPPGSGQPGPGLPGQRHAGAGEDPALPADLTDPPGAAMRVHDSGRDRPRGVQSPSGVRPAPNPA
jgi:hypothetical protein